MKIHLQFYRLYLVWFTLANLAGIWLFFNLPVFSIILLIKLIFYAGIYLLARPFTRQYFCYFQNLGYSPLMIFIKVALVDLAAFSLVLLTINLVQNAAD